MNGQIKIININEIWKTGYGYALLVIENTIIQGGNQ